MTTTETITGTLTDLQRLPSSRNGNPRYQAVIGGRLVQTAPDSSICYKIGNYRGQDVTATARILRGKLTIETLEATA